MAGPADRLNQVRLSVTLSEKKAKRFTPGGLPVLRWLCRIAARSKRQEADDRFS